MVDVDECYAYLGVFRVWSVEYVTKQNFRIFIHDASRGCVALIGTEIVAVSPSATDELFKVIAGIELLVFGGQVMQELRRCVNAGWSQA